MTNLTNTRLLKSHYFAGWSASDPIRHTPENVILAMQNTENSSLPTETIAANTYGCITTGHLFSPDNTVTAAITGNPRWPSHSLQQLASDKNNAHALAAAYRQHGPELFEQLQGDFH